MTPEDMAALMARAYRHATPWSAKDLAATLATGHSLLITAPRGFLLGSTIADTAEILALAVAPEAQRTGLGRELLERFADRAGSAGARQMVLEVAADNAAAIAFYTRAGFATQGRRKEYYARGPGPRMDALVMTAPIPATT